MQKRIEDYRKLHSDPRINAVLSAAARRFKLLSKENNVYIFLLKYLEDKYKNGIRYRAKALLKIDISYGDFDIDTLMSVVFTYKDVSYKNEYISLKRYTILGKGSRYSNFRYWRIISKAIDNIDTGLVENLLKNELSAIEKRVTIEIVKNFVPEYKNIYFSSSCMVDLALDEDIMPRILSDFYSRVAEVSKKYQVLTDVKYTFNENKFTLYLPFEEIIVENISLPVDEIIVKVKEMLNDFEPLIR